MWYKVQFLNSLRPLGTSLFGRKRVQNFLRPQIVQIGNSTIFPPELNCTVLELQIVKSPKSPPEPNCTKRA